MQAYFDNLQEIKWDDFLNKFKTHMESRSKKDKTEEKIYLELEGTKSLKSYQAVLNETGLENLILPHHAVEIEPGKDPDRPVKTGGDTFHNVRRAYFENYVPNSRFIDCTSKAIAQKARFFDVNAIRLKADFLFVCNQKQYAHPGEHYDDSHGEKKIYIGNGFHRFVAYSLWISENGFKPLEVYYVE